MFLNFPTICSYNLYMKCAKLGIYVIYLPALLRWALGNFGENKAIIGGGGAASCSVGTGELVRVDGKIGRAR